VTLKKPWQSPRGRLYPAGTVFSKNKTINSENGSGVWYDFAIPNGSYGLVLIPDSVFKIPTEHDLKLRQLRKKMVEDHKERTKDPFLN
jgi:hypothetical protein